MRSDNLARKVRLSVNLLATVAAAAFLAACSDSLERLTQSFPGSNPSDADPVYTASVPKAKNIASPSQDEAITSSPIQSADLSIGKAKPDYTTAYRKPSVKLDPEVNAPVVDNSANEDVATAEPQLQPEQSQPVWKVGKSGKLRVEPGMTMYSIARANNLSVPQLAKANGIRAPYTVAVGQVLRIPGTANATAPVVADAATSMPAAPVKVKKHYAAGGTYSVSTGDTLYSVGRKFGVSPFVIADANGLKKNATLALGQHLRIPGGGQVAQSTQVTKPKLVDKVPETETAVAQPVQLGTTPSGAEQQTAQTDVPEITKPVAQPEVAVTKPVVEQPPVATATLNMRWPARGKIISEFGNKPNNMKNEGINISLPEGTPIKAADNGVVAYAGNELKGYGNLILIRHEGGFVTAYAHAKELNVKRGDTVKRGDIIATVGQTGAVTQPQLHFEVRKGAVALDPLKFLDSATAAN